MLIACTCETCGKSFSRPIQRRFCSVVCRNRATAEKRRHKGDIYDGQVIRKCEHCGKEFATWPSELSRGRGRFCSRDCGANNRTEDIASRFWAKVKKTKSCWLWEGANRGGKWPYGVLFKKWGEATIQAHRLSWEIHNGPIPEGLRVLHKCDVPLCVNPDHLFLGTDADNIADMVIKNRCTTEKMTQDQVDYARAAYRTGKTIISLAKEIGVSQGAIWLAINGLTWKHRRRK